MKFYATELDEIKPESIVELTYSKEQGSWTDEHDSFYFKHNNGSYSVLPVMPDEAHGVQGYFVVEVTDPNNVTATFKLIVEDNIVMGDCGLFPGVNSEEEAEKKLEVSGMLEPDMGFDFITATIAYAINEGKFETKGKLELEPKYDSEPCENPAEEETYFWKLR